MTAWWRSALRQDRPRHDGPRALQRARRVSLWRAALPGRFQGRDVTVLDAYEGVGAVQTGAMSEVDLARWSAPASRASAPAPDSSPPTRWRWSRRPWLTVPRSAMVPGVYGGAACDRAARGQIVMAIVKRGGPLRASW